MYWQASQRYTVDMYIMAKYVYHGKAHLSGNVYCYHEQNV